MTEGLNIVYSINRRPQPPQQSHPAALLHNAQQRQRALVPHENLYCCSRSSRLTGCPQTERLLCSSHLASRISDSRISDQYWSQDKVLFAPSKGTPANKPDSLATSARLVSRSSAPCSPHSSGPGDEMAEVKERIRVLRQAS